MDCFKCGEDCSDIVCGGNILKIDGKIICRECFEEFVRENQKLGKYCFEPYLPTFCTGFEKEAKVFETKEELLDFLEDTKIDNYTVAYGDDLRDLLTILDVSKDGKDWYVRGYVYTDDTLGLPNWRKIQKVF